MGSVDKEALRSAHKSASDEFEKTKSPVAEEVLRRIGRLYEIEAAIAGRTVEQRLATRKEHAAPILDELKLWFEAQCRRLSSKLELTKAMRYALARWDALTLYTGDGRIGIDNPAERSLRVLALTRKNFLFLGSDAGGERAAILYTVLESAKLNGLEPRGLSGPDHRPHGQRPSDQQVVRASALELGPAACQTGSLNPQCSPMTWMDLDVRYPWPATGKVDDQ